MNTYIKRMIVLCLLAAGGASAFGQTVQSMGTTQDNAAIYNLYYSYYSNGYGGKWMESYYATIQKVTPTIGFATIPEAVTYGNHTYYVRGFGSASTVYSDVQNVGSLTFKGDVNLWDSPVNFWSGMTGFTTLIFEGYSYPFDGDYTEYFKNSVGWVDVYLADKTESQIAELKRNAPWNQFHSVNYRPVKQTLTLNLAFSPVDINANVALYSLGDYETFSDADYNLDYLTPVDMSSAGQFEVNKFQRYLVVADYNHNKVEPHVIVNGLEYPMTPHYNIAFCQITVQGDVVLDVSFPSIATWECVLNNQTHGMVFVTDLGDKTSFNAAGATNTIPFMYSTTNGQTTDGLFAGGNYATVYVYGNNNYIPHLKRNGVEVTLSYLTRGDIHYAYYNELNVQQSVTYEWYTEIPPKPESIPVVKVIRTGEGDVELTGMWDWDGETWYNTKEIICRNAVTDVTIPLPTMSPDGDGEYWGFEVNVRPQPGGTVRNFMIGRYTYDSDTGTPQLTMEEDVSMTQNADGSYSFIVDAFQDYIEWSSDDYVVFVDLDNGASDTNTQTFARYGGTGRVSLNYEENYDDYDPDIEIGTTTITLPDYNSDDCTYASLYVDKVPGEKFTAYRDGVDVTDDFIPVNYNNQYAYSFDKNTEHYRQSSVWTLIFEQTNDIIEFADAKVKAICVENWDTNEDGELSYEEAAAVTDIGEVFKGNTEITSFDEFQHFTGVTRIGKDAFRGDTELTSIVLPQSVVQIYGGWAFYGCSSLEHVVLPDNIGIVDTATFGQTNISSINFPETANLILGYGVITHAPLKSLFIPANVVTINDYVIYNCPNLACISVDEGNTIFDSREGCNAIIKTSTNTLIASCKNSVIPESVTALGNYAFFKTDGLTKLELPAGLTSIGKSGIRDCSSFTTIVAHMPEPFAINTSGSSNDYNISDLPANCKLVVPAGKRQAYIDAGWTETIFRGGVVEAEGSGILGDVNGDGQVTIADVTALVNIILKK
ncbi:MAG: leucine-rich repeat protein [Bacteroidaceae bacterium]|nr:leucine-rich repeat protein [Bacteroidaceae bacterium]